MTKTWLMRRPVRRPVSRATTAPISSSVCRLPFISSSASPCADQLDRLGRRGVAVRGVDDLRSSEVDPARLRDLSMFAAGPTRIRRSIPARRVDGARERRLLARMRDRRRSGLQICDTSPAIARTSRTDVSIHGV